MSKLTYEKLKLPKYVNNNTAVRLRVKVKGKSKIINLSFTDVVYAAELAELNMLAVSDTGKGKTQLMTDIAWHHFGGDEECGNANWADGRPAFDITDLFEKSEVDLSSGRFNSDDVRKIKEDKTRRSFNAVDEINAAPGPKQFDFFDLADGKYTFNGRRLRLGHDDYSLFMATANLNKRNGHDEQFHGTFALNRALLNRAHLTLDLDHKDFRPTPDDELEIEERKTNPKVDIPEPQDISKEIIEANKKIREQVGALDPYMSAFRFVIGRGLDYCDKDQYKDKEVFPMLCGDCNFAGKDLCSLVKSSSERTITAVKALAYALSYIVELKTGEKIEVDPLDAALQAFRFTTYHGNLNDIVAEEKYGDRKQAMMNDTVAKLSERVDILRPYIPIILNGHEPVVVKYNLPKKGEQATARTEGLLKHLTEIKIPFRETDLRTELKGVGTDWIDSYVKKFGNKQ